MELSLGIFLNKKRIEKQISQRELAALCDVGNSTISRIEKDEVFPETITLIKITDALGIEYSELIPYLYANKDKSFVVDSVQTFLEKYQHKKICNYSDDVIEIAKMISKLSDTQKDLVMQMVKQLIGAGDNK